ncbi:MAG: ribosome-associated translation inhibitor RaiA [Microscillaceae bacterium]|nr:ribosome-associated translation inhibitor RaiA [Microscillaceae bacterium]MDW8460167.1 ribosome-associated translation inhibitor RaiA [Cytophagales bacterium]
MKLQIHSIHFDADKKLLEFIQKKLTKLETFFDRIIDGEVFLRLEKGDFTRENKVVEVKINLPGHSLFVKEQSISFESATDIALDRLVAQIKKYKEKLIKH